MNEQGDKRGDDDGLSPAARAYRATAPWLSAVWRFTGSALFGVALGYGADKAFGVYPLGIIVGAMVGNGIGFYAFITSTNRLLAAKSNTKQAKNNTPTGGTK